MPIKSTATPPTITAVDIAIAKARHEEKHKLYWQCQGVEQALRNQIEQAIETDYLQAPRNHTTQMLDVLIPEIIEYLQTIYGRITEQELSDREDELKNSVYDTQTPVDTVFNKITWFQDLCELSNNAKIDWQLVQLAYIIFNRTRVFRDTLLAWNKKNQINKKYNNFKIHMRTAYNELNEVRALTIEDSSIAQANLIQEISSQQDKMAQDIKESLQANILDAFMAIKMSPTPSDAPSLEETSTITTNTINSAATNPTIDSLMTIIKTLEAKVDSLSKTSVTSSNVSYDDTINPKTGKEWKRYCWTCGCCPHSSRKCPIKKPGHQHNATFNNRMGGSNYKCYPIKK